ncbi:hypothetical protein Y032_0201g1729 [Ancylostoma ceylanicum]|uniref:Uncharacterized protein n=1 Tax=Ancylostoma ceylanicum TaxID=53326 RepID=A0A016SNA2_9BILA|nr:hypothetical protein Y032_0201g1729 [Ancylostoma ceylanicum]
MFENSAPPPGDPRVATKPIMTLGRSPHSPFISETVDVKRYGGDLFLKFDLLKQELKQRLSRTSVSSDVDIDRIVKESKTTTITETRETIHFRPREGKNSRRDASPSTLEVPIRKRLSILDSTTDEKRPQRETSPSTSSHYYRTQTIRPYSKPIVSDNGEQGTTNDNVDDLAADYANLEKELKDINDKNKELRKRFFDEKASTTDRRISPSTSKQNGCSFNFIK